MLVTTEKQRKTLIQCEINLLLTEIKADRQREILHSTSNTTKESYEMYAWCNNLAK